MAPARVGSEDEAILGNQDVRHGAQLATRTARARASPTPLAPTSPCGTRGAPSVVGAMGRITVTCRAQIDDPVWSLLN